MTIRVRPALVCRSRLWMTWASRDEQPQVTLPTSRANILVGDIVMAFPMLNQNAAEEHGIQLEVVKLEDGQVWFCLVAASLGG
jgi:hypothetical protein